MTLDWLIGFAEGEGCFTWLSKLNNTTRNGKRMYYRRGQPQFLLAQNGAQVLLLAAAFLAEHGVKAQVWPKKKHGVGDDGQVDGSGAHELRVVGYANCRRIVELFDGRLLSDKKREQFERWAARLDEQPARRSAHHSCMGCRGVRKPRARMVTSAMHGVMRDEPEARAEFLSLIRKEGV